MKKKKGKKKAGVKKKGRKQQQDQMKADLVKMAEILEVVTAGLRNGEWAQPLKEIRERWGEHGTGD